MPLKSLQNSLSTRHSRYILPGAGVVGLLTIALIWLLLSYSTDSPGRNQQLIGRLHPVIVHLPIGILLVVFLYEALSMFVPGFRKQPVVLFLIWIGFVSAVASAFAGFYLSLTGGYDGSYLFWHKWLGVLVAVFSGFCFLFGGLEFRNHRHDTLARRYRNIYQSCLILTVVALSITGHLGGTLTHGPGYVTEYLPASFKRILLLDTTSAAHKKHQFQDIQKATIYDDLVQPVLQNRCVSCHGPSKTKGDLRLDSKEALQEGGENGAILQPGKPVKSELVRRITLPPYHEEVMPPDNETPLSIANTELIRWWIATGASFEATVGDVSGDTIPPAVQTLFDRRSAPPEPDQLAIYETDTPAADFVQVKRLNGKTPWDVSYLAEQKRFLDVRVHPDHESELTRSDLDELKPVRKQVAWLDLRERTLTDDAWAMLENLPLLNRLHVQKTNIRNRHLQPLSSMSYLVFLNLYRTEISDTGLDHLNVDALDRLIVWQTEVSDDKIEELNKAHPNLDIERGITDPNETTKSLSYRASVSASNVFKDQTDRHGPAKAVDGDPNTRWATDGDARDPWIKIDLDEPKTIAEIEIDEAYGTRIKSHTLAYRASGEWKPIYEGDTVGPNYEKSFDPIEAQVVRLNIHSASNGPTIHEIRLHGPEH